MLSDYARADKLVMPNVVIECATWRIILSLRSVFSRSSAPCSRRTRDVQKGEEIQKAGIHRKRVTCPEAQFGVARVATVTMSNADGLVRRDA
jgi:hypothetical protein